MNTTWRKMASTMENEMDFDRSSSSSWEDIEDEEAIKEEEIYCHSLLLNSLIVEKIFEFLPIADLLACRLVCREWNKTVLLRKLLGTKFQITVSKANFDRLLKTSQTSPFPFCRKFDFRLLELEYDKIAKFIKIFGGKLNSLSIKFCSSSSAESVVEILNCPRLEELKIYGALPEIREENFHSFIFTRLKVLELFSSLDYGQVSQNFIKIILKCAPNVQAVNIGQSMSLWNDFCNAVSLSTAPKLCHVGLSGIEGPLEVSIFEDLFTRRLPLHTVNLQSCLVRQDFLQQFLQQAFKNLTVLNIEGTQQEILSKAFRDVTLPNVKHLTLPIDGVSLSDGTDILQSSPRLQELKIIGLFITCFTFESNHLISITMHEGYLSTLFSRENLQTTVVHEKRREFLKILALIPLQPLRLEISLVASHINSRCLRAVYAHYPDLKHLVLVNNSAKQFMVGLTGIPYRILRKMIICKSFSVLHPDKVCFFPSLANLKSLRSLELTVLDETPSTESTLLLVLYGICSLTNLKELILNNFTMSDISFMVLSQKLKLSSCEVNGTQERWMKFKSSYQKHTIKSFLLPPTLKSDLTSASERVGLDSKMLVKILNHLDTVDVFESRKVCSYWHTVCSNFLHDFCSAAANQCITSELEYRLNLYRKNKCSADSPSRRKEKDWNFPVPALQKALQIWQSMKVETTVAIVSLEKTTLEFFQLENFRRRGNKSRIACPQRRQLEYWYYPDGSDEMIYPPISIDRYNMESNSSMAMEKIRTLLIAGCWGRKDTALLEFLNPSWSVSTIQLIGLHKEALDLVLPKLISMMNLEALQIKPFSNSSTYCELTRTHLQILSNGSFKLRKLTMQVHAPSEAVVDFVRSQRFTLENLELHSNVNLSDRLTFAIPQLKLLQLDEPLGCLLWTTLNVHSNLETINFGRSGCAYNQVKIKSNLKMDLFDTDFEHSATEILCDVNWFLECATSRRAGAQKSILQQGTDSALKFFTHFPYLSSLTLRGVHAHYGILQGIFKKFTQLKKLELINASGVTDEILTGFSKGILDDMDIMNPFQVPRDPNKSDVQLKKSVSIRNLKCLTHLSLDDQPTCTDFSVIFGILKLHQLEFFSCKKWKITDVALRALADVLPSLREVDSEGCTAVSKYALDYFNETRTQRRFSCKNSYS